MITVTVGDNEEVINDILIVGARNVDNKLVAGPQDVIRGILAQDNAVRRPGPRGGFAARGCGVG